MSLEDKKEKESVEESALEEISEEGERTFEERITQHIHATKGFLFASFLAVLFVALFSSIISDSNIIYGILGFSPTLITILIFIWLISEGFKDIVSWATPLLVAFLFLVFGPFINALIYYQLDITSLAGINLTISYIVLIIALLIDHYAFSDVSEKELEEFKEADLGRYLLTVEDKCKAINFVIGRVYRASNGGTKKLREKLRIPREWYNEFNEISPEDKDAQRELAIDLLKRIKGQLSSLLRPEKDVFTASEVKALKNLKRDSDGKDRILDVLIVNDNDPLEEYFLGAMDFCKRIIDALEKKKGD